MKGIPDNQKVHGIARSIIATGYHGDQILLSRSLDLTAASLCLSSGDGEKVVVDHLLFGDGGARVLASRIVWQLLMQYKERLPFEEPTCKLVIESVMRMPTLFEQHGDGSVEDQIVAQAVKQNITASLTTTLSTLAWIGLVKKFAGNILIGSENPALRESRASSLMAAWTRLVSKYENHADVVAFSGVEPLKKKPRRSRGGRTAAIPSGEGENASSSTKSTVQLGTIRKKAIQMFIQFGSEAAFVSLKQHLVWASAGREDFIV